MQKLLGNLKKKEEALFIGVGKHPRIDGQKLRTCVRKVGAAMERSRAIM